MKKLIILSIALLLISSMLIAQKMDNKRGFAPAIDCHNTNLKSRPAPMGPMMDCMDELNLTDAQKTKFAELRTTFSKTENTLQAEIENLRIDLRTAMKDENYKQAKDLNKQIATKETALADARIDFTAARQKELTKEQKEILKNKMPMMMGMHSKGMMGKGNKQGMMMDRMHRMSDDCNDCDDQSQAPNHKPLMESPK